MKTIIIKALNCNASPDTVRLQHCQAVPGNPAVDVNPDVGFEIAVSHNNPPEFSVSTIRHKVVSLSGHDDYGSTFVSDHLHWDSLYIPKSENVETATPKSRGSISYQW